MDDDKDAKRRAAKSARAARYRAAHADEIKARKHAYYLANREARLAWQKVYDTARRDAAKLRRQGA